MNHNKKIYDTIIIGAGVSGLFLSTHLKSNSLVLEINESAGKKLAISGGGCCNFSNLHINKESFTGSEVLINSALSALHPKQICEIIKSYTLDYEIKKKSQLFLKSSAKDLVNALVKRAGQIKFCENVQSAIHDGENFIVKTANYEFLAQNLVIASGGMSYPIIGASDIGYKIATHFGHTITTIKPALVGMTLQPSEAWFKDLSGVSLQARLKVNSKTLDGDLLFAHKGISGPIVLNASLYHEKGFIEIDFLPDFEFARLKGQKQISTILPLPKRFIKAFLDRIGLQDIACDKLKEQNLQMLKTLKEYKFAPAGTFGYSKAEITKGGVNGDEIDPNSFESRLQKNLFILGETLDVNGELGGYNIHFALASALICAKALSGKRH